MKALLVGVAILAPVALTPAQALLVSAVDGAEVRAGDTVYDSRRERCVMVRKDYWSTQHDLLVFDGAAWVALQPPVQLGQAQGYALTYDQLRGEIVAMAPNRLVTIRGATVTLGTPPPSPSPSWFEQAENRAIAHDPARDEFLTFGGSWNTSTFPHYRVYANATYVMHLGSWQQRSPATVPPERSDYALVYDPVRQRTVMFGGLGPTGDRGDTWEWNGTDWVAVAATGPAAGPAHGSWDPVQQRVLIGDDHGAIWSFDGVGYAAVGSNTVPAWLPRPVHDGTRLLVAVDASLTDGPSTWQLIGNAFQRIPTAERPVERPDLAIDTVRNETLAVVYNRSTWTWNGAWTRHAGVPPAGRIAFDSARGEGVLFGGTTANSNQTWTWNGQNWSQRAPAVSPSPRTDYRLGYDATRQRVLLYGGVQNNAYVSGTWLWDGATWTTDPSPQPPAGRCTILEFDPARDAVVMTGETYATETWEWNGQWQQRSAVSGTDGAAAFDPQRGRVVAFYAHYSTPTYAQLREWDGTSWSSTPLNFGLQTQYGVRVVGDPVRNRLLLYGLIHTANGPSLHVLGPTPTWVVDLGGTCAASTSLLVEGRPAIGTTATLVGETAPATWSLFGFAPQPTSIPFGNCTAFVDGSLGVYWRLASATGRVDLPITIPNALGLRGFSFVAQSAALQSNGIALSRGLRLFVGD